MNHYQQNYRSTWWYVGGPDVTLPLLLGQCSKIIKYFKELLKNYETNNVGYVKIVWLKT